jgi:hypothetical protein
MDQVHKGAGSDKKIAQRPSTGYQDLQSETRKPANFEGCCLQGNFLI